MSDNAPPPPPPSNGPPPVPTDGLGELGLDVSPAAGPPAVPGSAPTPAPYDAATTPYAYTAGYGETPAVDPASLPIANPGWRALAFAIDGGGTFIVTTMIVLGGLAVGGFGIFVAIPIVPLLSALLATVLTATMGVTPGKAIVGLRVVHVVTGRPIGAWAILRSLVIVSPLLLWFVVSTVISQITYSPLNSGGSNDLLYSLSDASYWVPVVGWIALLIVVIVRPRHRGLEDLVGRSIVVRRGLGGRPSGV
jgi:uncharacterized RDD family membrane protein YckC